MTLTIDEKFALLQDMKVIDNNRKIVERLKKRIKDGNELCQELFDKGVAHPSMESEIEALEEILGEEK